MGVFSAVVTLIEQGSAARTLVKAHIDETCKEVRWYHSDKVWLCVLDLLGMFSAWSTGHINITSLLNGDAFAHGSEAADDAVSLIRGAAEMAETAVEVSELAMASSEFGGVLSHVMSAATGVYDDSKRQMTAYNKLLHGATYSKID